LLKTADMCAEFPSDISRLTHGITCAKAATVIRALVAENERLREALEFYANPEIYKPDPHGPAFDRRDVSFHARAALGETK